MGAMKAKHSDQDRLELVEVVSDKFWGDATSRMRPACPQDDVYEIRPRKDGDGFGSHQRSAPTRPNLVCRTRRSPQRRRVCELPLAVALAQRNHPRV
jgi:hypothetical protein